jgi:DNA replicative helicase MCM subunit Mcm2 (Cdc46/Mcm family)
MIYQREFQNGFGNDPRNKWYAVFHCDACGHNEWVPMPWRDSFDKGPRVCPKCHSLGVEDLRKSLEAKRARLQAQEAQVREEIEKVIQELQQLERSPA